ncbi:MAG: phosphatase PAP2 family protein [Bacteroidetes bacterium]|nr:phosphatase PAP2 family protein [Bacteroidota bacterium]
MRTYLICLQLTVLLLVSQVIYAEVDSAQIRKQIFKRELKADSLFSLKAKNGVVPFFFHSLGEQACAPFRISAKQALVTAGVAATTVALFSVDHQIDEKFRPIEKKHPGLWSFNSHFTELGDYYGYALLAGYGLFNLSTHHYKGFHTAVLAAQAAATAGVWLRVGKVLAGRIRPGSSYADAEYNYGHWFGPFAQFNSRYNKNRTVSSFDAFPSGHTGAAFAMATVFAKEYKEYKAVPFIAYATAGLVGVSRLVKHEHWLSDVVAGGFIGYLCGTQVCNYNKRINSSRLYSNTVFIPMFQNNGGGITMLKSF